MTEKTLDWLNNNRYRAYPIADDSYPDTAPRNLDCVLLDCLVTDTRTGKEFYGLIFRKVSVSDSSTTVTFSYCGGDYSCTFTGGDLTGPGSFQKVTGEDMQTTPEQFLFMSFTFSSHAYIKDRLGTGTWSFSLRVLDTKILRTEASGVSGIKANGSLNVKSGGTATGDVHLVDGYRTQPVIDNGQVVVKVGTDYGYDPCNYDDGYSDKKTACDDLMFFFCGQNAINSGDIVLSGGSGVKVTQGREYTLKSYVPGASAGDSIPCIEISATKELLNIYSPTKDA